MLRAAPRGVYTHSRHLPHRRLVWSTMAPRRAPACRPRRAVHLSASLKPSPPKQAPGAAYITGAGNPLTPIELSSLHKFCTQNGVADVDSFSPMLAQEAVPLLGNLDDGELLEGAMLALEQLHLAQRSTEPSQDIIDYLHGTWRMTFATGGFPRRQVVPVLEYFTILPSPQKVVVKTLLGPITPVFTGDYVWDRSQRMLQYDFQAATVSFWERQLLEFPFALKDRKAQFFFIGDSHACARSGPQSVILFERDATA